MPKFCFRIMQYVLALSFLFFDVLIFAAVNCPKCGYENQELDRYCLECASPIRKATEAELAHIEAIKKEKSKSKEDVVIAPPAKDYRKAVAFIKVIGEVDDKPIAQGSGFSINNRGYIITNFHVIENCNEIYIYFHDDIESYRKTGKESNYEAKIIKVSQQFDLALLKIKKKTPYLVFPPENETLSIGETVRIIGNPEGLTFTMTQGIISALPTTEELGFEYMKNYSGDGLRMTKSQYENVRYVQTDAAVNPGNSGGPVLNQFGEVIGVATMKIMYSHDKSDGYYNVEGLNWAIHYKIVEKFLRGKAIISKREKS